MILFVHVVILGVFTCLWFAQTVLLLHMHGNANLLARRALLLLTGQGICLVICAKALDAKEQNNYWHA